uniref:RING-type E3 ubiquitin transferase n=1 Tax=Davidia involucrata TaxID=16924 RepID=A0A5B7BAU2_DAVIN
MEEVSNLHVFHRHNVQQQEHHHSNMLETPDNINDDEDLYAFESDSLSPSNISLVTPSSIHPHNFSSSSDSDSDSDSESDFSDTVPESNDFYGEDQMNFVTNLFGSTEEQVVEEQDSVSDPFVDTLISDVNFRVFDGSDDFDLNYGEELGLGFGSRIEFDRVALASESPAILGSDLSSDGLRVVGIESSSDSEEVDVNSGYREEGTDRLGDSDIPLFWDCLGFEDQRATNEELEWEEVDARVDEREGSSSGIDRIEEISVSSEISTDEETGESGEEAVRILEWEVLLAVNNLYRASEFEHDDYGDGEGGYIYADEYDTIFGQFVQNDSALKGSPPAAKSVVEGLPLVVLTKEELQANHVICAVCKDEILVDEKVTRLPCRHHYHRDCIVPWLSIHNTCPVCRYELPTDDPDYEQRKSQRDRLVLPQDLQVRYNFELLS